MASDLLERANAKCRRDGVSGLLELVALVGVKEPVRRYSTVRADDVASYAKRVVTVEDGSTSEIAYDGQFDPPYPPQLEAVEGKAVATPRLRCEFRDATVVGTTPLVRVDGKYVDPSTMGTTGGTGSRWNERKTFHHNVSLGDLLRRSHSRSRAASTLESAFLLTGQFDEFGHWTYEILPKLRVYEEYVAETGSEPTILTKANLSSWQRESLALLGYPSDSLHHVGDGPIRVDRLLVPSHRYLTWSYVPTYPSPDDLRWVRDRILGTLPPSTDDFGDRIFVSREDAPRRHVRNRGAVFEVLEEYDFESHEPGRLSFADQARLFSGANLVVGPYGAGVSNVVFAEDADFVELVVDAKKNIHHYILANLLGIDYEYVRCRPHREPGVKTRNSDLVVDTERLREVLEARC